MLRTDKRPAMQYCPADNRGPDEGGGEERPVLAANILGLCDNFPNCCLDGDNNLKVDTVLLNEAGQKIGERLHIDSDIYTIIRYLVRTTKFKLKKSMHGSLETYQELLKKLYENVDQYEDNVFLTEIRKLFGTNETLTNYIQPNNARMFLSEVMLDEEGGATQGGHYGANEAYRFFVANWNNDGFKDIIALTRPEIKTLALALEASEDAHASDDDIGYRILYCLKRVKFNAALDEQTLIRFYFRLKNLLREGRELLKQLREGSFIPYLREVTLGDAVANKLDTVKGFFSLEFIYKPVIHEQEPVQPKERNPFEIRTAPFFTRTYRRVKRFFSTILSPIKRLDSWIQDWTGQSIFSGLTFVFSAGLLATRWTAAANSAMVATTAVVTSGLTLVAGLSCFVQYSLLAGMTLNVLEIIAPRGLQDYTLIKVIKKVTRYVRYAEFAYNIRRYFLGGLWSTVSNMFATTEPDDIITHIAPANETVAVVRDVAVSSEILSKAVDFFNVEHATMCSIMANDSDAKVASDGLILLLSTLTIYLKDRTPANVSDLIGAGKKRDGAIDFFKNSATVIKRITALLGRHSDLLTKEGSSASEFIGKLNEGLMLFEQLGKETYPKRGKINDEIITFSKNLVSFWNTHGPGFVTGMGDSSTLIDYMKKLQILQEQDLDSTFPSTDLVIAKTRLLVASALMIIGLYMLAKLAKYIGGPLARSKAGLWGSSALKSITDAWNKGKAQRKEDSPVKVYSIDEHGNIYMRELPAVDPELGFSEWREDLLWGIFGLTSCACLLFSVFYGFAKDMTVADLIKYYVGSNTLKSWRSAASGVTVKATTSSIILNTTNTGTATNFMNTNRASGSDVEGVLFTFAEATGEYGLNAIVGITQFIVDSASSGVAGLKSAWNAWKSAPI